jgi:hypothetical protein
MTFVIDTNSLGVLKNYYPQTFASLWTEIDRIVSDGTLLSVEEVFDESEQRIDSVHMNEWIKRNKSIFAPPTEQEMAFVAEIFQVSHFRQLVSEDALLRGGHVADPWLIARAKVLGGCVVTEEKLKPQAAKIPNVCQHFQIDCCNVEELLRRKGWRY